MTEELYGYAEYHETQRAFVFPNRSRIKMGYCDAESDVYQYQGQEYDVIGLEEATHFTERQREYLTTANRGTRTDFTPRMYYTANPGGVGHAWVKRLFIDREYNADEREQDYTFIPATVEDNPQLLEASPEYKQMLDLLPDNVRKAWRDGDWNAMAGTYFPEFRPETHVVEPFVRVPQEWRKYRAFDYGLDMFACLWVAVDYDGRAWVYREVQQSGLIASEAARLMTALTSQDEVIFATIAPPDMWSRQKDTGKNIAEIFAQNGVGLIRASNNRIQGWMAVKEMLKPMRSDEDRPGLLVTNGCRGLIRNLGLIQCDDKNPSDCATEPHDLTHICDALRYFCATRTLAAQAAPAEREREAYETAADYDEEMTGGEATGSYLHYGGG